MRHYSGEEWTETLFIEISLGFLLNYWRPPFSSRSVFPGLPIDDQQTGSGGETKAFPQKEWRAGKENYLDELLVKGMNLGYLPQMEDEQKELQALFLYSFERWPQMINTAKEKDQCTKVQGTSEKPGQSRMVWVTVRRSISYRTGSGGSQLPDWLAHS